MITLRHQQKSFRKQASVTTFDSLSPRVFQVFRLPALGDSASYARNTIALLTKAIEVKRLYFSIWGYVRKVSSIILAYTGHGSETFLQLRTHLEVRLYGSIQGPKNPHPPKNFILFRR